MTPASAIVKVIARRQLAPDLVELTTDGGDRLAGASPGQFVMLRGEWGRDPLLPRAYSILDREGGIARYLVKRVGRGSRLLAGCRVGESLRVLGPLGRPFPPPAKAAGRELLVAGGVGLAPLLWYARLRAGEGRGDALEFCYGARTAGELVLLDEMVAHGVTPWLATEDGTAPAGFSTRRGLVTELAAARLASASGSVVRVLACGPHAMMKAVVETARHAAPAPVECWVSLEGEMACGVGLCLGCAVPAADGGRSGEGRSRRYHICCSDGPVFNAEEIEL